MHTGDVTASRPAKDNCPRSVEEGGINQRTDIFRIVGDRLNRPKENVLWNP